MYKSALVFILSAGLTTSISTFAASKTEKSISRKPASITKSYFIGHNLTPSTDTIRAGSVTAGNYALGYAITDNLLLATSPWIFYSYNTTNLHLKYTHVLSPKSDIGFFVSYFDSYNSGPLLSSNTPNAGPTPFGPQPTALPTGTSLATTNRYQWTSYSAHALYGYHYDNGNIQYFNVKYSYFLNDELPYSLRMDPGDDSIRDQIDVSTLLRVPVSDKLGFNFETGLIGLNYLTAYNHFGASFAVSQPNWMLQLGASYTVPTTELGTAKGTEVGRWDDRVHYSEVARQYYTERYLQVAVHPEIQFQLYF